MRTLFPILLPLAACSYLTCQYSFWIAVGIGYFTALSLIVLLAFLRKTPQEY